jgi:hypothetical protein
MPQDRPKTMGMGNSPRVTDDTPGGFVDSRGRGSSVAGKTRESSEDRIDQDPGEGEVRTAKGKALPRGESDMNILSEVRDRDIRDARADWKNRTEPGFEGLIEATLEPEEEE